jgi:hypothetical protein
MPYDSTVPVVDGSEYRMTGHRCHGCMGPRGLIVGASDIGHESVVRGDMSPVARTSTG